MGRLTMQKWFEFFQPDEETTTICVDGYTQIVENDESYPYNKNHFYLVGEAVDKLANYEKLEEQLQSVYGECDGLLEKVVEGLVKHEGAEFEKPTKARLLTDDDVDKWDRLKGAMERIVERLEEKLSIARQTSYGNEVLLGIASGLNLAIEIVKEEM